MINPLCTTPAGATLAVTVLLSLAACATTQPPPADLAVARASIAQAESAGAADYASSDLVLARHKLDEADAAVKNNKTVEAQRLASEAVVDADVAGRKARAAKAERAAIEIQRSNAMLSDEMSSRPANQ
jgi:Domain of unknown function (DUF4398)